MYKCFVCMYIYAPSMCVVHKEARRGHGIPWDWSCRCLWATLWILGIKPRCSGKANSVLDCWAISPVWQKIKKVSSMISPKILLLQLHCSVSKCWCASNAFLLLIFRLIPNRVQEIFPILLYLLKLSSRLVLFLWQNTWSRQLKEGRVYFGDNT